MLSFTQVPNFLFNLVSEKKLSSDSFTAISFILSKATLKNFVFYKKTIVNGLNISERKWRKISKELICLDFIELKLNLNNQYYICVNKLKSKLNIRGGTYETIEGGTYETIDINNTDINNTNNYIDRLSNKTVDQTRDEKVVVFRNDQDCSLDKKSRPDGIQADKECGLKQKLLNEYSAYGLTNLAITKLLRRTTISHLFVCCRYARQSNPNSFIKYLFRCVQENWQIDSLNSQDIAHRETFSNCVEKDSIFLKKARERYLRDNKFPTKESKRCDFKDMSQAAKDAMNSLRRFGGLREIS